MLAGVFVAVPSAVGSVPGTRTPRAVVSSPFTRADSAAAAASSTQRPTQQGVLEQLSGFGLKVGSPPESAPHAASEPAPKARSEPANRKRQVDEAEPVGPRSTTAPSGVQDRGSVADSDDTFAAPNPNARIWITQSELGRLPTSGRAWNQLKSVADGSLGTAAIADQNSKHDIRTLAVALVFARTRQASYGTKARDAIMSAIGTESGDALALSRNLVSYVIAADLAGLPTSDDQRFRSWLRGLLDAGGRSSLRQTHEIRPNNHGTYAGASRAAAAAYLGDSEELARTAQVFRGYLGDRSAWSGFRYGEGSWQCDAGSPVGVNPVGCTKDGHPIDGALPDDQRRGGSFAWPPPRENYVYGALQGATVQAEILTRAGYPAWEWQDRALLRAFQWLHTQAGYPATGDDQWQPWLVNKRSGSTFPATTPARPGKNMGFTDWTHA